jgi:hypothetical protein
VAEQLALFPISAVGPIVLGHWPGTRYDGAVADQAGHGYAVAYHPGACDAAGCHHALVWHGVPARTGHRRPCQVPECPCARYRATPTRRRGTGSYVVPRAQR